jgi:hypothetical protein
MIQVQDIFEHNDKLIAKYQLMIVHIQVELMMNDMSMKIKHKFIKNYILILESVFDIE